MIDRASDRIRFVTRHFRELQGFRDRVPLGLLILSVGWTSSFYSKPELIALGFVLSVNGMVIRHFAPRLYERAFGAVEPLPLVPAAPEPSLSIFPRERSAAFVRTEVPIGWRFASVRTEALIGPHVACGRTEILVALRSALTFAAAIGGYLLLRAFSPSFGFLDNEPRAELAGFVHILYALCGAFGLVTWFTRGRRLFQAHHLALGLPLLALAVAGARLGSIMEAGGATMPFASWIVPTLVDPWVAILLCGVSQITTGLLDHWQLVRAFRHPARLREAA